MSSEKLLKQYRKGSYHGVSSQLLEKMIYNNNGDLIKYVIAQPYKKDSIILRKKSTNKQFKQIVSSEKACPSGECFNFGRGCQYMYLNTYINGNLVSRTALMPAQFADVMDEPGLYFKDC